MTIAFDTLPWDDIVYVYIFPLVSLQTLFILRCVSHSLHSCVTGYFQVCQDYDFTHVGPRFNSQSFRIAVARNVAVRQLNLCNHRDWLVDDTLQHVLEANCKLAKINLTGCSTLTSLTVLTLASCCPLLKELDLSNCHWLESEQFDLLASKCQDLERVSVSGCWNLNDDAIVALADSCKRIRVLSVAKIFCLTDRSISNVARQCPQLEHLDLRGCWRITDDAVRFLSEYTKHLRVVQVRECSLVTEASLAKLRAKGVSIDVPNYNHYRNMINLQV